MKKTVLLLYLSFILTLSNVIAQNLMDWGEYEPIKKEAIQRIEQHRKGDLKIKVVLPNQQVAVNTPVQIQLKRHDFKFGAVVGQSFATSPYKEIYRENFLKYFNASGFGLALKPKREGSIQEEFAETVSMPWFKENDIYVRGHTLAWEGARYFDKENFKIYNDTSISDLDKGEMLVENASKHFYHALAKWDVECWDVSNEPIANNDINELLPNLDTHVHWFKLADSLKIVYGKKHIKLYQNDYQIISAITKKAASRPAKYREILDNQLSQGAPINGIGFQSRIKSGMITPDTIYNRLCDFDRYDLPYQATEFEIRDNEKIYVYSDKERKLITEYMMLMYFSHPKVEGFWHWTFADRKADQVLDYPLFNYDGTPKVTGLKWIELMEGFFNTDVTLTTDANGELNFRGYYGDYEVRIDEAGRPLIGLFNLDSTEKKGSVISVSLK